MIISTTINKYCYITIRELPDFYKYRTRLVWSLIEEVRNNREIKHPVVKQVLRHFKYKKGLEIHYDADLPSRSGLGSSSSFTIGFLNAFYHLIRHKTNKRILTDDSIFVERKLLKEFGGIQDQIQISHGGFNMINIDKHGKYIVKKNKNLKKLNELKTNLLLFYTGIQRHSSMVTEITLEALPKKLSNLKGIYDLAVEAQKILFSDNGNLNDIGLLMDESWNLKRDIHKNISNSIIDNAYNIAKKNGALGGKILGSGGGGHLLLFCNKKNQAKVINALHNFTKIDFNFDNDGSQIIYRN